MPVGSFDRFIRTELKAIAEFRKAESIRQHRQLTDNEAAELWARTRAAKFREDYEKKHEIL